MQPRPIRVARALALLTAFAIVSTVADVARAAEGTAKPKALTGRVTVNKSTRAGPQTVFKQGDAVTVDEGVRLTLRLEDGAEFDVVGPAQLQLVQLQPDGNRVRLTSGYVSEAYVRAVALEVQTPYGPSLVLQNASARARVVPGDKLVFQSIEGSYMKVYERADGAPQDLKGTWTKDLRTGTTRKPGDDPLQGDSKRVKFGDRYVTYSPASDFGSEDRSGGVTRLTYNGSDFGVVEVGVGTVLFLGPGEHVDFDANGDIVSFNGISHVYHPIDPFAFYDEPIENAADASIADPRRR